VQPRLEELPHHPERVRALELAAPGGKHHLAVPSEVVPLGGEHGALAHACGAFDDDQPPRTGFGRLPRLSEEAQLVLALDERRARERGHGVQATDLRVPFLG
jgi:hypothetical protein